MLNILICDDKAEWRNEIQKQIENSLCVPYNLTVFSEARLLLDFFKENSADIIVTDIQMPETGGIELAKEIHAQNPHTQIIFTSAFTDYIQDVFSVNPVYYLLKPYDAEKFKEAFRLAVQNLEQQQKFLEILSQNKAVRICISEVRYVESDKRTVIFHETDAEQSCYAKLDDVENELPGYFIRCHKSYLVNMNQIKRISNNQIELFSGEILPVAKSRFPAIKQEILKFWEAQL